MQNFPGLRHCPGRFVTACLPTWAARRQGEERAVRGTSPFRLISVLERGGCGQWTKRNFCSSLTSRLPKRPSRRTKVGEDNLAEEAEALADKVDRAEAQASITPREVKTERSE